MGTSGILDYDLALNLLLIAAGFISLALSIRKLLWAIKSSAWPSVDAEVTNSDIVYHPTWKTGHYETKVQYRYSLNGVQYESDRIDFIGICKLTTKRLAERRLEAYAIGKHVPIRIHPDNPAISVLEPGATLMVFLSPLVPATMMTLGIGGLMQVLGFR
jgi:hypothetical protein